MQKFQYIVSNPKILGGKPCVKGTRLSVDLILEWLANGATINQIQQEYTQLTSAAISEVLLYASFYLKNEVLIEVQKVA